MKRNKTNQSETNAEGGVAFKYACLASGRKALARITGAKEMIFAEAFKMLKMQERLIRLALNEAEALAWQTLYPELVFPGLATEKVQALIAWNAKSQSLQRANVHPTVPA